MSQLTGYMLWFEAQGNTSEEFAKSAPSVWRALGGEEKKVINSPPPWGLE